MSTMENKGRSSFALMDEMEKNENLKSNDLMSRRQRMRPRTSSRLATYSVVSMTPMLLIGAIFFCAGMFVQELTWVGLVFIIIGIVEKIVSLFEKDKKEE